MTLEQLRIFEAVAEREHVTRAAEALNLTQSAVSAAIAALESDPERPLSANLFCTAKIYSFDQFVRAQQESLGDGEADGLCGFDVNHQLEFGRELHRQLAYLSAAQDAVDVRCGPAIPIKSAAYARSPPAATSARLE